MKIGACIRSLFVLPPRLRGAFYESAVKRNRVILTVISVLVILMESFNLCRVLFWSDSGLGTRNNRIYFAFYLTLLGLAAVNLLLHRCWWERTRRLLRIHRVMAAAILLWSAALNVYDVCSGHTSNTTVLATPVLVLAVLLQAEPRYLLPLLAVTYGVFVAGTWQRLDGGALLNLAMAVIMGMVSVVVHFYYVTLELRQRQDLDRVNAELRAEQDKLRVSLEQHRIIMEQSSDIMFRWDLEADSVEFSHNWTELFGVPSSVPQFQQWLMGDNGQDPELGARLLAWFRDYEQGKRDGENLIQLQLRSGEKRWYRVRVQMQRGAEGRAVQCIGVLRDVSEQQRQIERLQSQLQTDGLTGIYNRATLEAKTTGVLMEMQRDGMVAMLILDLDNFKLLNDTYGHPCGDYVLEETARALRQVFRESDILGRIGGDEFAAVLPGMRDPELLRRKTAQLTGKVRAIRWRNQPVGASCSIGGVLVGPDITFDQLYRAADQALYQAKRMGKGRVYLETL